MEARTPYSDIDFKIRQLTDADFDTLSAFSCGVEDLDDFFHYEVRECVAHHYLAAYCAYEDSGEIIALFTLMNDALMITGQTEKEDFIGDLRLETSEDIVEFFNRQSSYPAINIGPLGISVKYQSRGIGTAIVDLVAHTYANHTQSGCQFITVDALNNPRTKQFYLDNSFNFQTNRDFYSSTRRMYRIL